MVEGTFNSQLNGQQSETPEADIPTAGRGFQSQLITGSREARQNQDAPNILQVVGSTFNNSFVTATLLRDMDRMIKGGWEESQSWNPDDDEVIRPLFEEYGVPLTEGVARRLRNTVSETHARAVMDRSRREIEHAQRLDTFWGGDQTSAFLFELGASLVDPAGWAAGGVAGRLAGAGLKGSKMAQLAGLVDDLPNMNGMEAQSMIFRVAQAPAGRGEYALRAALGAAAADGSLEAYHLSRSALTESDDYIIAGLGALAIGGVFGSLNYKGMQRSITQRAVLDLQENLQQAAGDLDEAFGASLVAPQTPSDSPSTPTPQNTPDAFSGSSVGSARLRTEDGTEAPIEVDPIVEEFDPGQNTAVGNRIRLDAFASFGRSLLARTRAFGSMLLADGAASRANQGGLQHFTVEEIAGMHERTYGARFGRVLTGAYDAYKKANNIQTRDGAFERKHYEEFSRKVAMAVRGDQSVELTPEIIKARDAFRKSMADQLRDAQAVGLMTDVDVNDLYVPRFWRRDAFIKIREEFGDQGDEVLTRVIGKALAKSIDDVEVRTSVAEHIIRLITSKSVSDDELMRLANMTPERARAKLKAVLGENVDDAVLDTINQIFSGRSGKPKNGQGPRSESRIDLDESASIILSGNRKVHVADLFNNDLLSINTLYSRQIGGRKAFAEVSRGRFKSNQDIEDYFAAAGKELEGLPTEVRRNEERNLRRLRSYADYLLGHGSLGDDAVNADAAAFLKFLRDVSFARLMGQVAYAQLGEVGTAVGALGVRAFLQGVPKAVQQVMGDYTPGKSEGHDHLLNVIADQLPLGQMHISARVRTTSRQLDSEDVYGSRDTAPGDNGPRGSARDGARGKLDKIGRAGELAARAVSFLSGLQFITDVTQLSVANGHIASMARNVKDGKHLLHHPWLGERSKQRQLAMGIDEEWNTRITEMLREISVYGDNGVLKDMPFNKATDQAAVDHFLRVITRESRRIVQEGDLGTSREVLVNPWIRTILQFKSFVMNAHVKQMLYGASMRDAQLGTEFLMSSLLAGMGQMAKYNLMTLGMGDDRREEYLEYSLGEGGADRIVKSMAAAIRYSSHSGLLPDASDTLTHMFLGERYFDHRNSGLSTGFLDVEASAAYNTVTAPAGPIRELIQGDNDDAVRKAMSLGPNLTPIRILGNVLQEQVADDSE